MGNSESTTLRTPTPSRPQSTLLVPTDSWAEDISSSNSRRRSFSSSSSGRLSPSFGLRRSKKQARRLPPVVIDRILEIFLARAYEEGRYRAGLKVLKSVNREIRDMAYRQSLTNVYILSSRDLQAYEKILLDHLAPPPFLSSPSQSTTQIMHPRDLMTSLTILIGTPKFTLGAAGSILDFVSEGDLRRLLTSEWLSSNLRALRVEFGKGHVEGLGELLRDLGGRDGTRIRLRSLDVRCRDGEACRKGEECDRQSLGSVSTSSEKSEKSRPHSYRKERRYSPSSSSSSSPASSDSEGGALRSGHKSHKYRPFSPPPSPSPLTHLTHLSLSCPSTTLARTLLLSAPSTKHLRLSGAYAILPSIPSYPCAGGLKSVCLELKNGRRDVMGWGVPAALSSGLLSPISPPPLPRSTLFPDHKKLNREEEQRGEEQRTLYLEGVNELTLRWRGDLSAVSEACRSWGVRLVQPPPPPYEMGPPR